jgi:hypothetical protein
MFDHAYYLILENDKVIFIENRKRNIYKIKTNICKSIESCLVASINDSFLWHRILGHMSMDILLKLVKNELVRGLPYFVFKNEKLCDVWQVDKQVKYFLRAKTTF